MTTPTNTPVIEVPRKWLGGLIELAQKAEGASEVNYEKYSPFWHTHFAALVGYIESAIFLLK